MTKTKSGALFRIPIKGSERVYLEAEHAKRVRAKLRNRRKKSDLKIIGSVKPKIVDIADKMYEDTPVGMPARIGSRQIGYRDEFVTAKASKFLKELGVPGTGLYASMKFSKGDVIIPYKGVLRTDEEIESNSDHFSDDHYLFDILAVSDDSTDVGMVEDAEDPSKSNAGRYVNSANSDDQQNSRFIQIEDHVFLQAIKPIKKGEEILSYYGDDTDYIVGKKKFPKKKKAAAGKSRRL